MLAIYGISKYKKLLNSNSINSFIGITLETNTLFFSEKCKFWHIFEGGLEDINKKRFVRNF